MKFKIPAPTGPDSIHSIGMLDVRGRIHRWEARKKFKPTRHERQIWEYLF